MPSTTLKDLPNEIITKVLSYLETRDLFFFGHLSTRTRALSRHKILWQKVTIDNKTLATEFLKFILRNDCKFLKLTNVQIKGSIHLRKSSILKNLSLNRCAINHRILEDILGSCHSLTKLTLRGIDVSDVNTKNMKKFVLQNSKTLQVLDLATSKRLDLESIQIIIKNLNELKEFNLHSYRFYLLSWNKNKYFAEDILSEESINYIANNLTEKVEKLNLGYQRFVKDAHVMKLIPRCKRLTELNLRGTSISPNSLTCIIENLKHSLVMIRLCNTNLNFDELAELAAMPKLKVLNCSHLLYKTGPIEALKRKDPDFRGFTNHHILTVVFSVLGFKFTF